MKMNPAVMAGALIVIAAVVAGAHHSAAPFDTSTEKVVEGTVKQFDWTNPHTWVWLDVPRAGGGVDTWGIEGMSPNYLARRGWSKNTLKVGDKVSAVIRPMKDGSHGGMFVSVKLASGQVMRMTGEPTQ